MDFNVFDTAKMDAYAKKAKEQWGQTTQYREYEEKTRQQSPDTQKMAWQNLMLIFKEFGELREKEPDSQEVHKI